MFRFFFTRRVNFQNFSHGGVNVREFLNGGLTSRGVFLGGSSCLDTANFSRMSTFDKSTTQSITKRAQSFESIRAAIISGGIGRLKKRAESSQFFRVAFSRFD